MWDWLTSSIWPLSVLVINLWAVYQIVVFVINFLVALFNAAKKEIDESENSKDGH